MEQTKVTKDLENKTLIIERVFNAPKEKVWRAYSEQAMFEKWWGPEGFQTTTKEFDFQPGGRVHYCMKCEDKNMGEWYGKESWGLTVFEKIDAPNKFSAKDYFCSPDGTIVEGMPAQRLEIELVEENGKTRLINRSITETAEQLEELIKMGMVQGFSSQLNRLEKLLAE